MSTVLENRLVPGTPLPPSTLVPLASVTVSNPGWYLINAIAGVKRDPVAGFFVVGVRRNSSVLGLGSVGFPLRSDTDTQTGTGFALECATGDVLDVFVTQVSRSELVAGFSYISASKLA